jgi:catechol 2,3-dioxygenase-like lactoylglutathione lyase family enzyme
MKCEIKKIHHSGISVRDLQESVKFYEEYFGFKKLGGTYLEVEEEGHMKGVKIKIAFLKAGDDELELLEYVAPKEKKKIDFNPWDTGVQHVSFKTTHVRDFYEKNKDSLVFLTVPVDYKTDEIDTTWTYLKDPNGSIIELSEDRMVRGYWTR